MALVAIKEGEKLLVQIGDGAGPEVFTHDCLINLDRAFEITADTNQTNVPDCASVDAPSVKKTRKTAYNATISGRGLLHTTSLPTWDAWVLSKNTKNVKVTTDVATGGRTYTGAYHLTKLSLSGTPVEGYQEVNVELILDGALTPSTNS